MSILCISSFCIHITGIIVVFRLHRARYTLYILYITYRILTNTCTDVHRKGSDTRTAWYKVLVIMRTLELRKHYSRHSELLYDTTTHITVINKLGYCTTLESREFQRSSKAKAFWGLEKG